MKLKEFVSDVIYDVGFEIECNDNNKYKMGKMLENNNIAFYSKTEVGTQYEFNNRESAWSWLPKIEPIKNKVDRLMKYNNVGSDGALAGSCHLHIICERGLDKDVLQKVRHFIIHTFKWKLRSSKDKRHDILRNRGNKATFLRIWSNNDFHGYEFRINENAPSYETVAYYILALAYAEGIVDYKFIDVPAWNVSVYNYHEYGRQHPQGFFLKEIRKNYKKIEKEIEKIIRFLKEKEPNQFNLLV